MFCMSFSVLLDVCSFLSVHFVEQKQSHLKPWVSYEAWKSNKRVGIVICGREVVDQMKWERNTSKWTQQTGCWGSVTFTSGCLWISEWYATFLPQQANECRMPCTTECLMNAKAGYAWHCLLIEFHVVPTSDVIKKKIIKNYALFLW